MEFVHFLMVFKLLQNLPSKLTMGGISMSFLKGQETAALEKEQEQKSFNLDLLATRE